MPCRFWAGIVGARRRSPKASLVLICPRLKSLGYLPFAQSCGQLMFRFVSRILPELEKAEVAEATSVSDGF